MTYETLDGTMKVSYWAGVVLAFVAISAAAIGFAVTAIVCAVFAVTGTVAAGFMMRELRRRMRVHNLTIVTVKLDKAIANLDDSARV